MTEGTVSPAAPSTNNPGFLAMVWGVLAKPRITFATLRHGSSRAWIILAILGMILVTLPIIASGPITTQQTRDQLEEQFQNQPGFEDSGVDVEQAASFATSPILTTVVPAVFAAIGRVLSWLLWAGALYLLASMVGGNSTFLQVFQVVIWAWLPYMLRAVLQAVYITATQTLITNPGLSGFASVPTPDPSDPFGTLPTTGEAILQAFLGQIDIYLFWNLALLTIGITAVTKLSWRKSFGLVLIVWVVFMAVRLIFTAVSTNLASGFVGA
ncbi:Yip1 family protein [Candidatus Leptofilum sp.]|uniref:Yip1 family protein n=1 Tax=Candidatus Leptofilum sp. TaxID=3241576 RepID=UPI003B58BD11